MIVEEMINHTNKMNNIQSKYDFDIPRYILDEIVSNNDKDNLNVLINLAVMNNRLSKKNAKIIKKIYCKIGMFK